MKLEVGNSFNKETSTYNAEFRLYAENGDKPKEFHKPGFKSETEALAWACAAAEQMAESMGFKYTKETVQ